MVKTRSMKKMHPSKTVRKIYRRRIKHSRCRRKSQARCRTLNNCKYITTTKRKYCRMKANRTRLARALGKGRRPRTRRN